MLPLPGDIPQNLVVELSQDSFINKWPPSYLFNIYFVVYDRFSTNRAADAWNYPNGPMMIRGSGDVIPLIGFNGYALSVDDPNKIKPFSVFPNPASDRLNFNDEVKGRYKIYNLMGKKIMEGNLQQDEFIDVGSLPAGMYLLEAEGRTFKFLKE